MRNPTNIPEGHRRCPKCERTLRLSAFGRDSTRTSGVQSKCRDCDNKRRKASWERSYWTPERVQAAAARAAASTQRAEARHTQAA